VADHVFSNTGYTTCILRLVLRLSDIFDRSLCWCTLKIYYTVTQGHTMNIVVDGFQSAFTLFNIML